MNKIPTAEQFFEQGGTYPKLAVKFAQLHVKQAVRAIIRVQYDRASERTIDELTKEALRNFYPLSSIK